MNDLEVKSISFIHTEKWPGRGALNLINDQFSSYISERKGQAAENIRSRLGRSERSKHQASSCLCWEKGRHRWLSRHHKHSLWSGGKEGTDGRNYWAPVSPT